MNTSPVTTAPTPTSTRTRRAGAPRTVRRPRPAAGVSYDKSAELLRFDDAADTTQLDAARMTLTDGDGAADARAAMDKLRQALPAGCSAKLAAYVPELPVKDVESIRPFVEDAIVLTMPTTSYTVETLLRPAMHFVYWAVFVVGADLDAGIIFTRSLIEHYVRVTMPELTEGTRRNYRAWLFRVAEAANPDANPNNPMPLSDRALEAPYTADELDVLDRWADGQRTKYLRTNAAILLALGCGVGLSASEMVLVRREDITVDDNNAVHVTVAGKAVRAVMITARYEKTLRRALKTTPDQAFVFLPQRTRTGNDVVSAFVGRTETPSGTPPVRARKMRNTWIVHHLTNQVNVTTLMQAAGLSPENTQARRFVVKTWV